MSAASPTSRANSSRHGGATGVGGPIAALLQLKSSRRNRWRQWRAWKAGARRHYQAKRTELAIVRSCQGLPADLAGLITRRAVDRDGFGQHIQRTTMRTRHIGYFHGLVRESEMEAERFLS